MIFAFVTWFHKSNAFETDSIVRYRLLLFIEILDYLLCFIQFICILSWPMSVKFLYDFFVLWLLQLFRVFDISSRFNCLNCFSSGYFMCWESWWWHYHFNWSFLLYLHFIVNGICWCLTYTCVIFIGDMELMGIFD